MSLETIHFKLRDLATVDESIARLAGIAGVIAIEPLFEHETDPELATLYVAKINAADPDSVLQEFSADPAVEFAEAPPKRAPI
ncbi:MAG TPA: hypothetical protein VLB83_02635 [Candidatus Paceibacterota bacterium]|nr:hypothetical protein [Candidatus Paceibacterota bacterium]